MQPEFNKQYNDSASPRTVTVLEPITISQLPTPPKEINMSFVLDVKTDFEKIEGIFIKFFKNEPKWAAIAEADLAFAAPGINTIVTLLAGPVVDEVVQKVITAIQLDLVLATKFVQAEDSSSNLTSVLDTLITNLQGLLTLSAVKNSAVQASITAEVTKIVTEIEAILKFVPVVEKISTSTVPTPAV